MKRSLRRKLLGAAALAGFAAAGIFAASPGQAVLVPPAQGPGQGPANYQQASAEVIARGKHLTDMGDCIGCHVANGGKPYAGGQYMGMPFGDISTPNITPDVETGIGHYTDAQFLRLMQHGIEPDGTYIYPAMPYPWYRTVKTDDLLAIKAYLFSLEPVHAPRLPNRIWFPFTLRPAIALWDALFVPDSEFKPDPKLNDEQNLGAYIVNGLEHCGECHNNRNFLGNTTVALEVEGGPITKWYAPNLRFDKTSGLGDYSDDEIVSFLHDGHSTSMGTVAGPMAEVIDYSTKYLTDHELHGIVSYLHTLPTVASYTAQHSPPGTRSIVDGQRVYLSHCASCHQVDGKGVADKVPALDGNGMVRAFGPQSMMRVVLGGLEARGPYAPMPGVGSAMTDQEVADVSNYVRQAWSNAAPTNASIFLSRMLREDTHTLLNGTRPDGCPALEQDQLKGILADSANGVEKTLHAMTLPTMLHDTDDILAKVRAAAPGLEKADVVNGLTIAYCPIVNGDNSVPSDKRLWLMTHFAERLYVQFSTNGQY